jgi:hypothetical protein
MRTFIINKEYRTKTHFYSQPESGRKIRLEFSSDNCYEHFKEMFSLKSFDIFCIQSFTTRKIQNYNLYKNCQVLETGTIEPNLSIKGVSTYERYYIMFQCEKIIMDITENQMLILTRKEKLRKIKCLE